MAVGTVWHRIKAWPGDFPCIWSENKMEEEKSVRIQKWMSDCGLMSRRAAEDEIRAGRVLLNGRPAELGQKVNPARDTVLYGGRKVSQSEHGVHKCYLMLNKPRGYVTTLNDERGRPCISELIQDTGARVYPVGRLDMDSEGLLLLTNDGEFANRMMHPRHEIPKIYHVKLKGEISPESLYELQQPLLLDGYRIRPVHVSVVSRGGGSTVLRMELFEGRNRQIRKMCEQCGLDIIRLQRIAIGDVRLGSLRPGKWVPLTSGQKRALGIQEDTNRKK